jgi:hypothetical protein
VSPFVAVSATAAAVGLVGVAIAAALDPASGVGAWVAAWTWALGVGVGAASWLMLAHAAPMRWFAALRPTAAALGATAVVLVPGVIPVLATVDPTPGRVLRSLAWLVVLAGVPLALGRRSGEVEPATLHRQRRLAAAGMVVVGFAWSLAPYDWILPLDHGWSSPIYGLVVVSTALVSGLAAVVLAAHAQVRAGRLPALPPDVDHALGRLLLTGLFFQAYVEFDQLMLQWIADLPLEVKWWATRLHGTWGVYGALLLVLGLFTPFAMLLSRSLKRTRIGTDLVAGWLLATELAEAWYRVLPSRRPEGPWLTPADVLAAVGLAGVLGLAAAAMLRRAEAPADPMVAATLRYRSP